MSEDLKATSDEKTSTMHDDGEDYDAEEALDTIHQGKLSLKVRRHEKMVSDITGMSVETVRTRVSRGDRRTVSDLVIMMNLPEETVRTRTRTRSSTDLVTKFGYAPNLAQSDLKLAEEVGVHGTASERKAKGISDTEHKKKIEEENEDDGFVYNHVGHTSEEAAILLEKYGKNELPENVDPLWLVFLRQFWAPMPIMIWLAILVEAGISNFLDMGILLAIQFTNAFISFYETTKAGNAVAALKSSLKPVATCKRDGKWGVMDATMIVPGDLVLLASGSAIPADCRVNNSEIDVDQAALTGESLPVTFYKGGSCKMGSTVVRGEVEGTVEFTGAETFFGKTASLLQDTHESTHLQIVLMTIMYVLVGISLVLCAVNFIYLLVKGVSLKESLSFTIVLLVASIPLGKSQDLIAVSFFSTLLTLFLLVFIPIHLKRSD
jgi:magnesium-transporting ATPase (P-type)